MECGISLVAKVTKPAVSTKVATPAATPFQKRPRASARRCSKPLSYAARASGSLKT
jgi:hypothetical protein